MEIVLNRVYQQVAEATNRYRVLRGGAGSGKSHFMAQETLLNMLDSGDYFYLVVRKTGKSIRHSVFQLLSDMIAQYELDEYFNINKTEMTITACTGSRLITSGLDNVEKLKSISGINRIWVEEASEISESDFNQLDLRMRGNNPHGHQITLTFNPISDLLWVKRKFFDQGMDDSFILTTTYTDNRFLDERYKQKLEALQNEDYQFYRIYTLGEWGQLGNLIYNNWEKADLTDEIPTFDNVRNGIDWGFADDPFAYVRLHFDKTRNIIYVYDEICQSGLHNEQAAEKVKEKAGNEVITCDSAEPKSISDFRRMSLNTKGAKKGKGSVEHGIKWIQGKKIVVDEGCINTIGELSSYKWREDKHGNLIPQPAGKNDHIMDAMRYALEDDMAERKLRAVKGFY